MGGPLRTGRLRLPARTRLSRRHRGDLRPMREAKVSSRVGPGRRLEGGVRQHQPRPSPGHAGRVPREGARRRMVEGGGHGAGRVPADRGGNSARGHHLAAVVEHRHARDGGSRRGTQVLPYQEESGRRNRARHSGRRPLRGRLRGHVPYARGSPGGQDAAGGMVHAPRTGVQRGQDTNRAPVRGVRLPRVHHQALPNQREGPDDAVQGRAATDRRQAQSRGDQTQRCQRCGDHRRRQPDHPGMGGVLPHRSVEEDLRPVGLLDVDTPMALGATRASEQGEAMGPGSLLGTIPPQTRRPMGVRRP